MKILMVASDNYRFSGAFLCLVRLAVHLKYDLNNEVRVVVPFEGTGTELLKENDIDYDMVYSPNWVSSKLVCKNPCEPLFSYLKFFNYKKYEKNVLDYLNQFKPDVVHINTSWCFLFGKVSIENGFHCVWQIQEFNDICEKMRLKKSMTVGETLSLKLNYYSTFRLASLVEAI